MRDYTLTCARGRFAREHDIIARPARLCVKEIRKARSQTSDSAVSRWF